jgi:transposase
MSGEVGLWVELPEQRAPEPATRAAPRLRRPERDQVGWHAAAIDDLIAPDHPARAVWAFVTALDLSELHDEVKAREGVPGQAPPDPALMLALWLFATVEGVGSARQLDRLCNQHLAYRWLCGGVSANYHTLSDFRVAHADVLEKLLAHGVAALVAEGLVKLEVLAQDGMKVRAAAGAGSFRRRRRLEELEAAAHERVRRLRDEVDGDPAAGERRKQAAKTRAAREQTERLAAALERMKELEAERRRREKTNKEKVAKQKEPRASSTDAQARVMKMADGGFRPAYNMQIVSAVEGQVIVAVDVETSGSDRGLARPAIERLLEAGIAPKDYLVDGGFTKNADIEWAHENDIRLTCPPTQSKHGTDPFAARDDDGPGMADWRRRMASEPGKALYQRRAQAECPNAWARRMGLSRLMVRGKGKARAALLLFALAHNMLRALALRAVPAAPAMA